MKEKINENIEVNELKIKIKNKIPLLINNICFEKPSLSFNKILSEKEIRKDCLVMLNPDQINNKYMEIINIHNYSYVVPKDSKLFYKEFDQNSINSFAFKSFGKSIVFIFVEGEIKIWKLSSKYKDSSAEFIKSVKDNIEHNVVIRELKELSTHENLLYQSYGEIRKLIKLVKENMISEYKEKTKLEKECLMLGIEKKDFERLVKIHNEEIGMF